MPAFAAILTAVVAAGTILITSIKLITKMGKNAATWTVVQEAFHPEHGPGLMERVGHMEDTLGRIEKRLP